MMSTLLSFVGLSSQEVAVALQIAANCVAVLALTLALHFMSWSIARHTYTSLAFSNKVFWVLSLVEIAVACGATAAGLHVALGIPYIAQNPVWGWTDKVNPAIYAVCGLHVVQIALRVWFRNALLRDGTAFASGSTLFAESIFGLIALPSAAIFRVGCWFVAVGLVMYGAVPLFALRRLMRMSGMGGGGRLYCAVRVALIPTFVAFRAVPAAALALNLGTRCNDVAGVNNSALLGFFVLGGGTLLVANAWWGFALVRCAVRRVRGARGAAAAAAQMRPPSSTRGSSIEGKHGYLPRGAI